MAAHPGPLAAYPSRAAHARAHRVAAERRRRDRRRARTGRKPISAMHYVTLFVRAPRLDFSPMIIAAFERADKAMAQAGEAMARMWLNAPIPSVPTARALPAPPQSTKDIAGFDTDLVIIDEAYTFTPDWHHAPEAPRG